MPDLKGVEQRLRAARAISPLKEDLLLALPEHTLVSAPPVAPTCQTQPSRRYRLFMMMVRPLAASVKQSSPLLLTPPWCVPPHCYVIAHTRDAPTTHAG